MGYVMNRPEEAAMQRLLARNPNNTLGVILRLAWLAGLTREEIVQLTWADISRDTKTLLLKDRRVPLCEDLMRCLEERVALYGNLSLYVAISEKYHDAMNPGSVSRMVRQALDSEGQTSVRLTDLRHDFIIRQLQVNDWAYVVQISGLAVETFQILYSDYITVRTPTKNKVEYDDEYRIWQILQKEKDSAIGLALWMRWYMDLQLTELVELTWDQVDFERNRVHLKTRDVELVQSVRTRLLEELGRRVEGDDPHVLLTEHSRTPVNLSNFSKLLRTTLIRGGVENLSFRDVRQTPAADGEKTRHSGPCEKQEGAGAQRRHGAYGPFRLRGQEAA